MATILLTLKATKGQKTWVAQIKGRSRKYGLDREFVAAIEQREGKGKKPGEKDYLLDEPEVYEISELGERRLVHATDGQLLPLSKKEAIALLLAREQELDNKIARFNTEGGFSMEPERN